MVCLNEILFKLDIVTDPLQPRFIFVLCWKIKTSQFVPQNRLCRWYMRPLQHFSLSRICVLKGGRSDFSVLCGGKTQLYNAVCIKK